jgi:bis(5'-nucleosidyl)-tetraphosphatase
MGRLDNQAPFLFSGRQMADRILSAGIVVVRRADDGWRVLLLRAYNYWDFPKGMVEPGEDPLTTARREVREETGIEDLEFRWGEEFTETEPYSRNKVARYYLASSPASVVKLPVSAELGRPEHHEYRWLSLDDARKVVVPRLIPVLAWAADRTA